jgi:hypothetical protein
MRKIKVRFNLGRGNNFMKWKIVYPNGHVEYHRPSDVQLIMKSCQLKNHKGVAKKIFNGGEKVICAWVLCEDITIINHTFTQFDKICDRLKYNPRVQPNWVLNGEIVDNEFITTIASVDFGLYKIN